MARPLKRSSVAAPLRLASFGPILGHTRGGSSLLAYLCQVGALAFCWAK
jgi:hypothetical protein